MKTYNTIAESNNFIILDHYIKYSEVNEAPRTYQTESALEREFIQDLVNQGYEHLSELTSAEAMLANVRAQLQHLNDMAFTDGEWARFVEEYLDKPSDNLVDKTRKIHDNYIYDFVFDDGHIQNIYLLDKQNIARNKVQVIRSSPHEDERHKIVVDIDHMIRTGDTSANVLLQPNDIVLVPPTPLGWLGLRVQEVLFPFQPVIQAYNTPAGLIDSTEEYNNQDD